MSCGKFTEVLIAILTWSMVYYSTEGQPAESSKVCLIVPPDLEQCYRSFENKPISRRTAQVSCLQKLLWNFQPDTNITADETALVTQLMDRIAANAPTDTVVGGAGFEASRTGSTISGSRFANVRSPSGTRIRREYRTLSTVERTKFHDAMRILYETNVIRTYARIHTRAVRSHHGGPSFLPWHRVYLVMFEEELRKVDPDVFLPYWDSTIDDAMDNPVNSVLWSPEYFGNGVGDVTSGFAAGWVAAQGNLERDYARPGTTLMKKSDKDLVLTQCNLRDISSRTARNRYNWERYHGSAHVWVGGDMGFPRTAGYEPVFYMHHAYIDYVWELFRSRQRRVCGVDPASDYPSTRPDNPHSANATMTGFPDYQNWDGIQDNWIDNWYSYAEEPTCPNCGDSSTMYCSSRLDVCVARSRRSSQGSSRGFGQSVSFFDASELAAIDQRPMPRNRGPPFDAPVRDDSRTLATAAQDAATAVVDPVSGTDSRSFPQTFDTRRSDSLARSTVGRSRNVDLSSVTGFHPSPRFRGHPFSAPLRKK